MLRLLLLLLLLLLLVGDDARMSNRLHLLRSNGRRYRFFPLVVPATSAGLASMELVLFRPYFPFRAL